jgi:Flp pilus assembly protein TadD
MDSNGRADVATVVSLSQEPEADDAAQDRVLSRLDYALRHLRATAPGAVDPRPAPKGEQQRRAALAVAMGKAHLGAGASERAELEFRDALSADPANSEAHGHLALTLAMLGRLDEAEQQLRAAEAAGASVSPHVREEIRKRRS